MTGTFHRGVKMWSPVTKCHRDIDMVVGFHYYKVAGDPDKKRCKG